MKKKVSAVIKDDVYEFYYTTFQKPEIGVLHILDCFPHLYRKTIKELSGMFDRNELYMIIDAFEGLTVSSGKVGLCLGGECLEAINSDGLGVAWNVDKEKFSEKLQSLNSFQTACLEMWAYSYWHGGGADSKTVKSDSDLEKHVEVLL